MKVYIQIGSTRERIEFEFEPSDSIKDVKTKIAEDRGIPIRIQRLFKSYYGIDKQDVVSDDTKLSQIKKDTTFPWHGADEHKKDTTFPWHDADEYNDDFEPTNLNYLRLYLYSKGLKINVRTLAGLEFSINCDELNLHHNADVYKIKNEIFRQKGYPTRMQRLYLGDSIMSELTDQEHILSPQICSNLCDYGLVLRVCGYLSIRSIDKSFGNKSIYLDIDAMDKVSKIKQKIINNYDFKNGPRNIHLYIDGKDIQNLDDDKRLCDYDIRKLRQYGLLMKQVLNTIFVKTLTGRTYELDCNLDDTIEDIKDLLESEAGLPPYLFRLLFAGKTLEDGRLLSDYNIQNYSTLQIIQKLLGD